MLLTFTNTKQTCMLLVVYDFERFIISGTDKAEYIMIQVVAFLYHKFPIFTKFNFSFIKQCLFVFCKELIIRWQP